MIKIQVINNTIPMLIFIGGDSIIIFQKETKSKSFTVVFKAEENNMKKTGKKVQSTVLGNIVAKDKLKIYF